MNTQTDTKDSHPASLPPAPGSVLHTALELCIRHAQLEISSSEFIDRIGAIEPELRRICNKPKTTQ